MPAGVPFSDVMAPSTARGRISMRDSSVTASELHRLVAINANKALYSTQLWNYTGSYLFQAVSTTAAVQNIPETLLAKIGLEFLF